MQKTGQFRALRNIPAGWVLQAIHSTDKTERRIRIGLEAVLIVLVFAALSQLSGGAYSPLTQLAMAFVIAHSLMWLLVGNFWVYLLDSFKWIRNPGLTSNVNFLKLCREKFVAAECCEAILVYGSACRAAFHGRSDLDLRIVRLPGLRHALVSVGLGLALKVYSLFIRLPVDLQVVDSYRFLSNQMRADEAPIVVYAKYPERIVNPGVAFADIEAEPSLMLRPDLRS